MSSVKVRELEPGYAYIRISQFQDDTAAIWTGSWAR